MENNRLWWRKSNVVASSGPEQQTGSQGFQLMAHHTQKSNQWMDYLCWLGVHIGRSHCRISRHNRSVNYLCGAPCCQQVGRFRSFLSSSRGCRPVVSLSDDGPAATSNSSISLDDRQQSFNTADFCLIHPIHLHLLIASIYLSNYSIIIHRSVYTSSTHPSLFPFFFSLNNSLLSVPSLFCANRSSARSQRDLFATPHYLVGNLWR